MLVFAHMMKTAGTSVSMQLIRHFGKRMHIVPGGLGMSESDYGKWQLENDLRALQTPIDLIAGHPMRPYVDFGQRSKNMAWFTFMREPNERYVSHFLHDLKWTDGFAYKRYSSMKKKNVIEWESIEGFSNYQTKFLAGEVNLEKAISVLESQMAWVGRTEEFECSMCSFKRHFGIDDFYIDMTRTNSSLAGTSLKNSIFAKHFDFINDMNQVDSELYKYFLANIWPRYRIDNFRTVSKKGKSKLSRVINVAEFQFMRHTRLRPTRVSLKNLKRFWRRWIK